MTCQTCGRPAEGKHQGHWIGCEEIVADHVDTSESWEDVAKANECEHPSCSEPKKEWSGKGAKPRYCAAGHKKEK
jgi:hypothetical protein